jgi:hypothetical protein
MPTFFQQGFDLDKKITKFIILVYLEGPEHQHVILSFVFYVQLDENTFAFINYSFFSIATLSTSVYIIK